MQAQPHQNPRFVELPINLGTRPNWKKRIDYPQLWNMYIDASGHVFTDPGYEKISANAPDENARAIHYSKYMGGSYFTVTKTKILQEFENGSYNEIATITNSGQAVQIDENDANQVVIVDGRKAYVYAQRTSVFTTLSSSEGFELASPISVVMLNNICIILDRITNTWVISDPNNAISWPALDYVASLDSALTQGVGLEVLSNNLFIFGTTGIERWVPSAGNNPYIFPFDKDTSYRQNLGAISTNSIVAGFNQIYFLSSQYLPKSLTPQGVVDLVEGDYRTGLAKIISNYPDLLKCETSFFTFKGNEFFTMSFQETGIAWKFNATSKTYSIIDEPIISALRAYEIVARPSGIYRLIEEPQENKMRMWIGKTIENYKGQQPSRMTLNGLDVQMIQGQLHNDVQELELSFSLDGQDTWTNTVNRPIGATGQRNAQTTWVCNITGKSFVPRIRYYGNLQFSIKQITAIVK
jgi:hypothetical protein